ncbi:MAG: glycosyltransferase family 2 protein [Isosphaeraceae bacterium]|nr:glycosyltransferase family 2 protein [Isosphaeraceae bacterium]
MELSPPTLTIIVPLYNEVGTIARVLGAVEASPYSKQILVVDDGSRDGSYLEVIRWRSSAAPSTEVEIFQHPENRGKGSAIRTALPFAKGRIVVVQDADLECDPADYPQLVEPILEGTARVVFGSRYLNAGSGRLPWTSGRLFVCLANALVLVLFGRRITDEAGCYKVMPTELLRSLDLRCRRFEFCPEVVAKLCRRGIGIHEVPVRYTPRDLRSGKKIGLRDAIEAIAALLRWRVAPLERAQTPSELTYPQSVDLAEARRVDRSWDELVAGAPGGEPL